MPHATPTNVTMAAEVKAMPAEELAGSKPATPAIAIPPATISAPSDSAKPRVKLALDTFASPVNQNGCFEFDRVIKSGYLQKRTQKTKTWKTIYLVMRPNTLFIYKSEKENKLRHKIYLSDLTAVTLLKDPKNKRKNVFGLFSPSKNFHLQAKTPTDAQEWVDIIRRDARIEEEEEEMFLASPMVRRQSYGVPGFFSGLGNSSRALAEQERLQSSSPEPLDPPSAQFSSSSRGFGHRSIDYTSGLSGNELASHSDFSDTEAHRNLGASFESLAVQSPSKTTGVGVVRPTMNLRNASQVSCSNLLDNDPDRVVWQGWLWFLRSKRGVRQWKDSWAVLRPRNLILYKDSAEYAAQLVVPLSSIVNVVELDPISRSKTHCCQVITEEKSYRFAAHDEESLLRCLGAFKSLLAKRRELEAKLKATGGAVAAVATLAAAVKPATQGSSTTNNTQNTTAPAAAPPAAPTASGITT